MTAFFPNDIGNFEAPWARDVIEKRRLGVNLTIIILLHFSALNDWPCRMRSLRSELTREMAVLAACCSNPEMLLDGMADRYYDRPRAARDHHLQDRTQARPKDVLGHYGAQLLCNIQGPSRRCWRPWRQDVHSGCLSRVKHRRTNEPAGPRLAGQLPAYRRLGH